ncbi:MAG: CBS domain-containing protein [Candidatus Woesearchaeota archaeon]
MKTGCKVCDAMTQSPITITPDTTVQECAQLMRKEHVGGIPVSENGILKGIITEQDITRKIVALGKDIKKPVKYFMVKKVITITPEKDIYDALILMRKKGIRHLPVISGKKLLGLLTLKDILKIQPQLFEIISEKMSIREADRKPVFSQSSGICQVCGELKDELKQVDGVFMCRECFLSYKKKKNKKS